MDDNQKLATERMHGHACFLYQSERERTRLLAAYFADGIANKELCIFVTPDKPREVIDNFKAVGTDITKAVEAGDLRIFGMDESYMPDGRFVADFMLQNVRNFLEDAKTSGYKGLRTAGEMAWLTENNEFVTEAVRYESDINGLGKQHPKFTGLCLYPVESASAQIMAGAMQTHPGFIYKGDALTNPYYRAAVA